MGGYQLSEEAEADLDGIWFYVAQESRSVETATQLVDGITDRFWTLAQHPYAGRSRDHDLRSGLRSLLADSYVIVYRVDPNDIVVILHVFHGHRDITTLFAESGR